MTTGILKNLLLQLNCHCQCCESLPGEKVGLVHEDDVDLALGGLFHEGVEVGAVEEERVARVDDLKECVAE